MTTISVSTSVGPVPEDLFAFCLADRLAAQLLRDVRAKLLEEPAHRLGVPPRIRFPRLQPEPLQAFAHRPAHRPRFRYWTPAEHEGGSFGFEAPTRRTRR
ncbi:MAG: hypothetical protein JST08_10665 [Actinobacteria bacterium]|nr:hypothetical protein [Actinomycetota bacterium]